MQYTEGEIVREYQQARYKNKQIGILSQLNTCSRKDIIKILEKNGVEVPSNFKNSHEEEYDYKKMVGVEKTSPKFKEPPTDYSFGTLCLNTKRKPKSSEPKQEEVKTPEEELDEEIEIYELNKSEKPQIDPEHEKLNTSEHQKPDGLYYTTWLRLELLDRRITKLERKNKRLKKLYKQLANFILG